ncbi:MAG: hypothetical protein KY432_08885 [Acidobacteria bacterium]|nr:hypothetical protein [Acidobacteriota bacterium]
MVRSSVDGTPATVALPAGQRLSGSRHGLQRPASLRYFTNAVKSVMVMIGGEKWDFWIV